MFQSPKQWFIDKSYKRTSLRVNNNLMISYVNTRLRRDILDDQFLNLANSNTG